MITKNLVTEYLKNVGVAIDGKNPYDIRVNNQKFFNTLMLNTPLAAGEGYMDKLWDCDQLDELFFRINRNNLHEKLNPKWVAGVQKFMNTISNLQSRTRSKDVAEVHYNLGNTLYRYMLGESMAYTCGYWKKAQTLDQAQYDKYDLICRKIHLKKGENVLDLGCGWGGFAKYAAENYGCNVVGVNISEEQVNYAKELCINLPVKIILSDYRDVHIYNQDKIIFDKVVSIGLCEHVGIKNYRNFMSVVSENMHENGLFLLHTIGKNYSSDYVDPWFNKYIFPHGVLPSIKLLAESMENIFILEDLHNFGADYDKTLMAWHKNFNDNWEALKGEYDDRFFRMWNYYLLSCAGAFRARSLQLWQMVLSPKGVISGYETIR